MALYVSDFFQKYAEAFSSYDKEAAIALFGLPSIVMTDERKLIMARHEDIAAEIDRVFAKSQKLGVAKFVPVVEQIMKMSETLRFCNVTWLLHDKEDNLLFKLDDSFTVQVKDDSFEIVAMVINDTDEIFYQTVKDHGTSNK